MCQPRKSSRIPRVTTVGVPGHWHCLSRFPPPGGANSIIPCLAHAGPSIRYSGRMAHEGTSPGRTWWATCGSALSARDEPNRRRESKVPLKDESSCKGCKADQRTLAPLRECHGSHDKRSVLDRTVPGAGEPGFTSLSGSVHVPGGGYKAADNPHRGIPFSSAICQRRLTVY